MTSGPRLAACVVALLSAAQASPAWSMKLHPVAAYTIEYDVGGSKPGNIVEYSRNHGNQQSRVTDTSMTMAGRTFRENTRVITEGAKITTIDFQAKTVTRGANPFYETLIARMKGKDAAEFGREMLRAMGHVETDATETILGETCRVWKNAQLGAEMCVTSDALTLRNDMAMGGIKVTMRARALKRGDGGPDSAYTVPAGLTETQAPDLSKILGKGR
ncbi:MAG: hypothetical protein AB7O49_16385 [Sphingomonadales bacterium]